MANEKFTEKIGSETVNFMKSSFNASMENVTLMQGQFEKLLGTIMDQAEASGAEGKKVVSDWISMQKKGLEEFKNLTEQNIAKMEEFFKGK